MAIMCQTHVKKKFFNVQIDAPLNNSFLEHLKNITRTKLHVKMF